MAKEKVSPVYHCHESALTIHPINHPFSSFSFSPIYPRHTAVAPAFKRFHAFDITSLDNEASRTIAGN